jgi:hypothetical protein
VEASSGATFVAGRVSKIEAAGVAYVYRERRD